MRPYEAIFGPEDNLAPLAALVKETVERKVKDTAIPMSIQVPLPEHDQHLVTLSISGGQVESVNIAFTRPPFFRRHFRTV